jgi:hypothetical protein
MERLELRPLVLGEIIRQSFRLYGEMLSTVVILALIAHLPLLLLSGMIAEETPPDPYLALGLLVVILLVTGVVVNAIYLALVSCIAGRTATLAQALRWSLRRPAVAVMLGYMLTNFVSHIGLLLLILPGLIAGGLLAVTVPAIVVERKGAIAGMGRSMALLRQNWAKGIGVFAFGTVVSELLPLQVLLGMQLWVGRSPFSPLLAALLAAITMPLALTANLLLYLSLRAEEQKPAAPEALRSELLKLLPAQE